MVFSVPASKEFSPEDLMILRLVMSPLGWR